MKLYSEPNIEDECYYFITFSEDDLTKRKILKVRIYIYIVLSGIHFYILVHLDKLLLTRKILKFILKHKILQGYMNFFESLKEVMILEDMKYLLGNLNIISFN